MRPLKFHLLLALTAHIAAFSLVSRVGFAVPLPRNGAQFFFGGFTVLPENMGGPALEEKKPSPAVAIKDADAAFFLPWMQMRQLNKPKL